MEEETGAIVTNSRVSSSASPPRTIPLPLPPAKEQPPAAESGRREMFSVELKPGETTIVSWRKLLKEAGKAAGKPPADPAIHSEAVPASADSVQPMEGDLQDAPPANRFSAVIEKIERLYMGEQSSDEEKLDDIPDDDQYDTEDSFIDDAELDEYFQVDKLSTKHNGYFVNRGKLEKIESYILPNLTPRKRRRKDPSKVHSENKHEQVMHEPVNTGNMRIKAAARIASLTGKKSWSSSANVQTNSGEHYQEGKAFKNKVNTSTGTYKKRSAEFTTNLENPSSLRVGKDVALLALETKDLAKHTASRDRSISSQVASQSRKSLNGENEARVSTKVRHKERYGTGALPDLNSAGSACPMQAVLAELWPNGSMDKYGIKDAIFRSKDRKRARMYRHKALDEERIKRKKMAMMIKVEESSPTAQVQSGQERPMDSTSQVLVPSDEVTSVQSIPLSGRMAEPAVHLSDVGYHHGPKHHAKARLSTCMNIVMDNGSKTVVAEPKKKIKIKPESDIGEIHGHPTQHGKEKHGLHKDEMNASHQPEEKPQLPVAPGTSDLLLS